MTSKRKSKKDDKNSLASLPTIPALVRKLGIDDWDALIVGDGSGSHWDVGAGWASVILDRYSKAGKLFYGAANVGTVTLGEFFPYLYAMTWYGGSKGPGMMRLKQAQLESRNLNIHIVTDSEIIARAGNNPESRRSYKELWAAFDVWRLQGFNIKFHHVGRDIVPLNVLVDAVSRQARLDMKETMGRAVKQLQKKYPGIPDEVSIYDFAVWRDKPEAT
jgi:hypothetical protein